MVLTIGSITLTVNSCKLLYASSADFSDAKEIPFVAAADSDIKIVPAEGKFPANSYYKFVFNVTNAVNSNKYLHFSKVVFNGVE